MKFNCLFLLLVVLMSCDKLRRPITAKKLWKLPYGISNALYAKDRYLYGCYGGQNLFKLDPGSGRLIWDYKSLSALHGFPDFSSEYTSFFDIAGNLHLLDRNGKLAFKAPLGNMKPSGKHLASWKHLLFWVVDNNGLVAYDTRTKRVAWTIPQAGQVKYVSAPVVVGDRLLIGGVQGAFMAVDASSGETLWVSHSAGTDFSTPLVIRDKVYAGSVDKGVVRFDLYTGGEAWVNMDDYAGALPPVVLGEFAYFHAKGDKILGNDALIGTSELEIRPTEPSVPPLSAIIAYKDVLVWSDAGKNLYIAKPGLDVEAQVIRFREGILQLIVCNGELLVAMDDGSFYRVDYQKSY